MLRYVNRWLILLGLSVVLLASACVQLVAPVFRTGAGPFTVTTRPVDTLSNPAPTLPALDTTTAQTPAPAPATPTSALSGLETGRSTAVPTPRPQFTPRQLAAVRRGPISQTLQLSGRVSANQEVPLTFTTSGTVSNLFVQPGDRVQAGQALAAIDVRDATKSLSDAQSALQISRVQLQQVQARTAAQARAQQGAAQDAAQARAADAERRQQRIQDATAQADDQLRQAQANLARVSAGAPAADRLAAEGSLASAAGALDKAQADLNKLKAGPTQAVRLAAQQALTTAQSALRKAEADRDKLLAPPDPALVAAAQREVTDARAEVERAGQSTAPQGQKISAAERQQRQASAELGVTVAKAKLDALLKGPDKAAVDLANLAVAGARSDLDLAQERLKQIEAGPSQDELTNASNAVEVARKASEVAQARLAEVNSHPTPAELADAQNKVAAAQQALDRAGQAGDDNPSAAPQSTGSTQDSDSTVQVLQLQQAINQQQSQVAALEQQIAASQLKAPFAGVVLAVQVQVGDSVDSRRPIVVLASGEEPIITADISDTNADVSEGMPVAVRLDNKSELAGTVTSITNATNSAGRSARVHVDWPAEPAAVGTTLQLSLMLRQKDNVLLVPTRAIRASGDRKTVDVVDDNQQRRTVEVSLGLSSGTETEILSGVVEGQQIILPNG